MLRAREVLPTPGTSSRSRCPSARRQVTAREMTSLLPWMKLATLSMIASELAANRVASSAVMGACSLIGPP
jgi:hypothetical protein